MAKRTHPLSDLQKLRDTLKARETARIETERVAAEEERKRKHEGALFRELVGEVRPLKTSPRVVRPAVRVEPLPLQSRLDEEAALAESLSDDFDPEDILEADDSVSWRREGIGPDVVRKLRRGHWVIQDQIDLHGARRDEAREMLAEFLRDCVKRGIRCVRVIHGKGLGSKNRQPVLKGKVRGWLVQKEEVLAFCQARVNDGGSGVVYVLLRQG